jgi:hypothetical protein
MNSTAQIPAIRGVQDPRVRRLAAGRELGIHHHYRELGGSAADVRKRV